MAFNFFIAERFCQGIFRMCLESDLVQMTSEGAVNTTISTSNPDWSLN